MENGLDRTREGFDIVMLVKHRQGMLQEMYQLDAPPDVSWEDSEMLGRTMYSEMSRTDTLSHAQRQHWRMTWFGENLEEGYSDTPINVGASIFACETVVVERWGIFDSLRKTARIQAAVLQHQQATIKKQIYTEPVQRFAKDWRNDAECLTEDPETFFPTAKDSAWTAAAKNICSRCDVQVACQSEAFKEGHDYGVWGGLTEDERRAIKRRKSRSRSFL